MRLPRLIRALIKSIRRLCHLGNDGFVKGFTASELVVTPAILGLAAVLGRLNAGAGEDA